MSVVSRDLRGRLLLVLYEARGIYVRLEKLYAAARDEALAATPRQVKAEMSYLESAEYVTRLGADSWQIEAKGVNLVEGGIDPDPGVIFPETEK